MQTAKRASAIRGGLLVFLLLSQIALSWHLRAVRPALEELPPALGESAVTILALGDQQFLFRAIGRWLQGFGDGDGAGEDMAAGSALVFRHVGVELAEPGWDFFGFDALRDEALGVAAGGGRLHDDGVAGVDGEDRLGVVGVVAPGDRGWGGEQGLGLLGRKSERRQGCCEEEELA